ncbi:CvfB family protein [Saccharibacillus sacchari]|uniref:CvfB family protein n=1 Tax=Saccharibacillus sacchari TaxID=456493 RepID=UPI0004B99AB4|nr:S1-like domain-containing RNA-binding protein [Saccharibacillus sacchari]
MSLEAGTIVKLKVAREVSPHGFFMTNGEEEVLLPYTERTGNMKFRNGQETEVFIHHDSEDRLIATMKKPLLTFGEIAALEVADIHPRLGCFLEMGLGRQLLLPKRELPETPELQPEVGDRIYVRMDRDKQGRLLARTSGEEELSPLCFNAPESWKNQWMKATVYRPLQMGTFVIIEGGVLGFGAIGLIHSSERPRPLRLGEVIDVRVTRIREEDGRVNLSMAQPKEIGMDEDAEKILAYMRTREGNQMPYSDKTGPDIIKLRFGISKAAFKRALGRLMKQGLIEQDENWTRLKSPEEASSDAE